jgi:hypothetical protein
MAVEIFYFLNFSTHEVVNLKRMACFIVSNQVETNEIGSGIGVELNPFTYGIGVCNCFRLGKSSARSEDEKYEYGNFLFQKGQL